MKIYLGSDQSFRIRLSQEEYARGLKQSILEEKFTLFGAFVLVLRIVPTLDLTPGFKIQVKSEGPLVHEVRVHPELWTSLSKPSKTGLLSQINLGDRKWNCGIEVDLKS